MPEAGSSNLWFKVNVAPPDGCGEVCGSVLSNFSSQMAKISFIIPWTLLWSFARSKAKSSEYRAAVAGSSIRCDDCDINVPGTDGPCPSATDTNACAA